MRLAIGATGAALATVAIGHPPVKEWSVESNLRFNSDDVAHVRIHALTRWTGQTKDPYETCANMSYTETEVYQDPVMWPYSGLRAMQAQLKEAYGDPTNDGRKREKAYRVKTAKYGTNSQATVQQNVTQLMQCAADSMDDVPGGPYAAVCTCLQRVLPEQMCSWTAALATHTLCLDQMKRAFKVDDAMCAELTSAGYGVPLSAKCTQNVAGSVESYSLELSPANYPAGTPAVITAGISDKETRTYYLLFKALERLIRFTAGFEWCLDSEDKAELEDIAPKFEAMESWITRKMWWLSSSKLSEAGMKTKLPFAILSSKSNTDSLLVLIRDARNSYEAKVQGTYEAGRQLHAHNDNVIVHAGYDFLARQIFPGLETYVAKWLAQQARPSATITYAGYGVLGSGVVSVLAHDMATKFRTTAQNTTIMHDLVVFDSGRVGNWNFNQRLAQLVNVRSISMPGSFLSDFPCEMPRACDLYTDAPTGESNGAVIGQFLPLPGKVEPKVDLGVSPFNLVATSLCSVPCWVTTRTCSDDHANSRCDLSTGCVPMTDM